LHIYAHTCTRTHTLTHTNTHTYTKSHTLTQTNTHAHTHTQTHTHTRSPAHSPPRTEPRTAWHSSHEDAPDLQAHALSHSLPCSPVRLMPRFGDSPAGGHTHRACSVPRTTGKEGGGCSGGDGDGGGGALLLSCTAQLPAGSPTRSQHIAATSPVEGSTPTGELSSLQE
jgi:hypothetical protein